MRRRLCCSSRSNVQSRFLEIDHISVQQSITNPHQHSYALLCQFMYSSTPRIPATLVFALMKAVMEGILSAQRCQHFLPYLTRSCGRPMLNSWELIFCRKYHNFCMPQCRLVLTKCQVRENNCAAGITAIIRLQPNYNAYKQALPPLMDLEVGV